MVKQAFKKRYLHSNPEKYRLFLKRVFTTLPPRWYSVAYFREIETTDGPMYAAKLVQNQIDNPALDPIAEVWINNEYVYLWNDQCYTIAVDKNNRPICTIQTDQAPSGWLLWEQVFDPNQYTLPPPLCDKVLLLHRIGHQAVE